MIQVGWVERSETHQIAKHYDSSRVGRAERNPPNCHKININEHKKIRF